MPHGPRLPDERHLRTRRFLRVAGPIILLVGVALTAVGFFTVIVGDPFEHSLRAALPFMGMPLMFVGGVMSGLGYMGALARYQAGEIVPVAGESFNRFADDTQPGVRAIAGAVAAGLRTSDEGGAGEPRDCPRCGRGNDADASFCDHCGEALPTVRSCPACGKLNDPDARYCAGCGKRV